MERCTVTGSRDTGGKWRDVTGSKDTGGRWKNRTGIQLVDG